HLLHSTSVDGVEKNPKRVLKRVLIVVVHREATLELREQRTHGVVIPMHREKELFAGQFRRLPCHLRLDFARARRTMLPPFSANIYQSGAEAAVFLALNFTMNLSRAFSVLNSLTSSIFRPQPRSLSQTTA